jgi:DNA-binding transcriptional MerR regulator
MSTFRIQEFAKLAGVTVRALHHYDRLKLLSPARQRAALRERRDGPSQST